MTETCFIRAWSNQAKIFSWDYFGQLKSEDDCPEATSGFLRKFLFSKQLIVYKREDNWFVYFLGKEIPIRNIQNLRTEKLGFLSKLILVLDGREHSFFELTPFDLFARKFDPTYDTLDSELVFGRWLVNLHQKEKK